MRALIQTKMNKDRKRETTIGAQPPSPTLHIKLKAIDHSINIIINIYLMTTNSQCYCCANGILGPFCSKHLVYKLPIKFNILNSVPYSAYSDTILLSSTIIKDKIK